MKTIAVDHDPFLKHSDIRDINVIRHGATKLNNNDVSVDRIRGWKDIPLSQDGKNEAERIGLKLRTRGPDILVSSDLKRALETAEIISSISGIPIKEVSRSFRPWNVGKLAGEISAKAIPILSDYANNKPFVTLPEGESFNSFRSRFFSGLLHVLSKYKGIIGVVTHHRDERLLKAWLKDGAKPDGEINKEEFNKKGEATGSIENLKIPMEKLYDAASMMQMLKKATPVEHNPFITMG